jgi:hypothetical protein
MNVPLAGNDFRTLLTQLTAMALGYKVAAAMKPPLSARKLHFRWFENPEISEILKYLKIFEYFKTQGNLISKVPKIIK